MIARLLILVAVASTACGSSNDTGCHSTEVEVDYIKGPRDGAVVCRPIPASCNSTASCASNDCLRDMYDLCDTDYTGVACSDTSPPTIISCNQVAF